LHELLGVDRAPGFAEGLDAGDAPLSGSAPPVRVLPAGGPVANPSASLHRLLDRLPGWRLQSELMLVDLADLSTANDAAIVAAEMDALILVCARQSLTPKRAPGLVRDAGRVGAPVLGVVLVEVPTSMFAFLRPRSRRPSGPVPTRSVKD